MNEYQTIKTVRDSNSWLELLKNSLQNCCEPIQQTTSASKPGQSPLITSQLPEELAGALFKGRFGDEALCVQEEKWQCSESGCGVLAPRRLQNWSEWWRRRCCGRSGASRSCGRAALWLCARGPTTGAGALSSPCTRSAALPSKRWDTLYSGQPFICLPFLQLVWVWFELAFLLSLFPCLGGSCHQGIFRVWILRMVGLPGWRRVVAEVEMLRHVDGHHSCK